MGKKYIALTGDLNTDAKKQEFMDRWNTKPEYDYIVGMIQMGIGLNLHAPRCVGADGKPARCSSTVFYGFDWSPVKVEQAMDRIYRSDQVETCLYTYLVSEDMDATDTGGQPIIPIDMRIYQAVQSKFDHITKFQGKTVEYIQSLLAP